ncbi:MAG: tetratricopeptide repeat protein [bacterium]|nr:tetratricopeptide repeat protein [bacterium]
MLYDVLPPLLLFISFGGIIIVFSRVILRMRHVQFSEDIQAEVDSKIPIHEESLLRPDQHGVTLVKNRLGHMLRSVGSSIVSMKSRRQEAKQKKAVEIIAVKSSLVQMPEVGLQDKLLLLAQRGREGLSSLQKEIANRIPDMQAIRERMPRIKETKEEVLPVPKSSPAIRLVRHTGVEEQSTATVKPSQKAGIMSQLLKKDKEKTTLEQATEALGKNDFERVEDILIPHIMKHSSDTKAYMLLGKAAIGKESWDEAMEIFQQVIKIDKEMVDAFADLGHAALNAGRFTLAIQSLQHARDMDSKNIRIREELLFIARRMDNKVVEKGVLEELEELKEKA